jgi:tripartite ATP-independent transporter DctP family solute receptor
MKSRNGKLILVTMMILIAATVFAGGAKETAPAAAQPMVLKWAEVNPAGHLMTLSAEQFAKALDEKSKGMLKVDIYPAMQLGDEKTSMQSLQMGAIAFFRGSALTVGDFGAKRMNLFGLPYVFRDRDHLWKVLKSDIGASILKDVQASGSKMVAVGYFEEGARHFFFTKKVVTDVTDMKGLKIRVPQTAMMMDMVSAFGANPTPISYSELYSSLQTGVVDGAENPPVGYLANNFFEVAPNLTLDYHSYTPCPILMAESVWNKLDDTGKKAVMEAAAIAENWNKSAAEQKDADAFKKLTEKGVKVSKTDVTKWQAMVDPVYEKHGKDFKDLLKQIAAIK